ncbi:cornifelin-like [Tubulanus polymorphus]|uniref:cornifelin-like n=1 Tax=Tubulanus polymorphus TaxID=672921 RepID=UPI003DA4AB0C
MTTTTHQRTVVVTTQPMNAHKVHQGTNNWSTGLLGCCDDCGVCICGYFCFPCTLCRISSGMHENACAPICCPGGLLALRTKLRVEHDIQGSICGDACALQCCTLCAVCQMERELKNAGRM